MKVPSEFLRSCVQFSAKFTCKCRDELLLMACKFISSIGLLKSDYKILFCFEFFPEKNKAHKKNIYAVLNRRVTLNFFPYFFHFLTPVNVIKNHDGIFISLFQKIFEITQCWFVSMVPIDICQRNRRCKPGNKCW